MADTAAWPRGGPVAGRTRGPAPRRLGWAASASAVGRPLRWLGRAAGGHRGRRGASVGGSLVADVGKRRAAGWGSWISKEREDGEGDSERRLPEKAKMTGAGRGCEGGDGIGAVGRRRLCMLVLWVRSGLGRGGAWAGSWATRHGRSFLAVSDFIAWAGGAAGRAGPSGGGTGTRRVGLAPVGI